MEPSEASEARGTEWNRVKRAKLAEPKQAELNEAEPNRTERKA